MELDKCMIDDLGFLWFEDLLNENQDDKWITITMHDKLSREINEERKEDFSIYSIMVPNKEDQIKIINEKQDWVTNWGQMEHSSNVESPQSNEKEKYYLETRGVFVKQFLCYLDHDKSKVTVRPDFVEKFNLTNDQKTGNYLDCENQVIIRFSKPEKIEIRSDYLRDYLAENHMVLIRNFQCRRDIEKPTTETIGKLREDKIINEDDKYFYLVVGKNEYDSRKNEYTMGTIMGHSTIYPKKM